MYKADLKTSTISERKHRDEHDSNSRAKPWRKLLWGISWPTVAAEDSVRSWVARHSGRFLCHIHPDQTSQHDSKVCINHPIAEQVLIILSLVRQALPDDGGLDIQHLRRFAKFTDLPPEVRASIAASRPPGPAGIPRDVLADERVLLIGSINAITQETLGELLSSALDNVTILSLPVPLLAPTSQEQAKRWSFKYWPTVYKKSNVFGPHPSLVSRAAEEVTVDVNKWLALAAKAADQAFEAGSGEKFGVVIVSRKAGVARCVATAGDARWLNWPHSSSGNVTAHAAMRAIAMLSEGLRIREEAVESTSSASISVKPSIFLDQPLGEFERENYHSPDDDGYLCHDLELYCTHEPCVMCSMAIVHSRFGRLVFKHRMPRTGGICADGKLGHGLFWRKELNWTLLAWQWSLDKDNIYEEDNLDSSLNA